MSELTSNTMGHDTQGEHIIDPNDAIIASMNDLRRKFISDLLVNGSAPKDKDDRDFLVKMMDGATRSALAAKKLKADEKAVVSQTQMVQNLVDAVRIAQSHRSQAVIDVSSREVPKLDPTIVPGHMDTGFLPINTTALARAGDTSES